MTDRPCGHRDPDLLEAVNLGCTRHRCRRRVVACVVYIGDVQGRTGWRIEPTCRRHLKIHEDTARRVRHRDHPGVYRHHPRMDRILEWIHSAGRCEVSYVALRTSEGYVESRSSSGTTRDSSGSQT